jgi:hypothetical protein
MAASLQECLELVVAHPYWQDVLSRAKGDAEVMRQIFRDGIEDFEDCALSDNPEIEEFRPLLRARLAGRAPRPRKTAPSCGDGAWR